MTVGLAPGYANNLLNTIAGTSFTVPAGSWAQLHIGDPGAAGTSNISSVTARQSVTWAAASGGSMAISNTPSWGNWTGTSPETITHLSFWSASTSGTFIFSTQLSTAVVAQTGFPVSLGAETITLLPVAA